MKKYCALIMALVLFTLAAACAVSIPGSQVSAPPAGSESDGETGLPPQDIPQTSGKDELPPQDDPAEKPFPLIDGSTSTLSIVRQIYYRLYPDAGFIPETASKTVPSYETLINGEVDMIIVPYASTEVLAMAGQKGVKLKFIPIAAEALIFITPAANTAENITMEQIREIYLNYGIKNWKGLGGPDRELIPICRNADSGSQSQMDNLVLGNQPMHPDIQNNFVELTMEGMLELVAFYHHGGLFEKPTDSYALGYTLFSYLENMTYVTGIGESLRILSFEGIEATAQTISDGTYPLADAYYAVILDDVPQSPDIERIINWLRSDDGILAIEEMGFIPIA